MAYPGGKNGAGVYQTLINLMPPHEAYIEPFLGGGAVMRLKRPARLNIGIDLVPSAVSAMREAFPAAGVIAGDDDGRRRRSPVPAMGSVRSGSGNGGNGDERSLSAETVRNGDAAAFLFECRDGIEFLRKYAFGGRELVYCDPPYLMETRSGRRLYEYEMSAGQHRRLLRCLRSLPCAVIISGYWSEMYAQELNGWTTTTFQSMTRGGRQATEWLWFNFPQPIALHDYCFLGKDFRERERIKRKKARWVERLRTMPILERRALLCAIAETA